MRIGGAKSKDFSKRETPKVTLIQQKKFPCNIFLHFFRLDFYLIEDNGFWTTVLGASYTCASGHVQLISHGFGAR